MASSSSAQARSIVSPKLYDVFISHRGPDVKETLAKQLYDLLEARGRKAFLDREEIEGGDSITSAIHNAIRSSRVQIAIFSKRYAESCWCLDELLLMLQQTDALFIPVFYGVQPSELRHIDNKSQYAAAFENYERKCRHLDKLYGWKKALASAAEISGYEREHHPEDLCEKIVSRVVEVMEKRERSTLLDIAKYPVGLNELVQDFESCCSKTAGSVGIFGLGGSGKTTLAKKLFNQKSSDYHASCFLSDVRESHARGQLHSLQRQLLKDLLRDEEIMSVHHGIGKLKDHLRRVSHLNFLIVLDDIDHQHQLDALWPEGMLGSGSLVIITTRDQSVLRDVDISYEMKLMDWDHARDLFCSHAFHRSDPPAYYDNLVQGFVKFCGGLPLSLMVLGAHVYKRDQNYWNLELEKVRKIQPKDIMARLKISFDGLDREEKQIFIDIACFFNKNTEFYKEPKIIWKASGWSAEHALEILRQKCLIERHGFCRFEMHDHLRDMGRQMADELGPPRLWQPELLRSMEENGFKQILAEKKDRRLHSFFDLSLGRKITYFIAETTLLSLDIDDGDNKLSFPSWIPLPELRYLCVWRVEELWSSFQQQINAQASFQFRYLKIVDCPSSQKLPDSIQMLSHLEELHIYRSLEETDTRSSVQSLKQLSNLRSLSLWHTKVGLEGNLDLSGRMDSLENIYLGYLKNISKLVISGEMCPRLQILHVQVMENLKEIELKQLGRLSILKVNRCGKLEKISDFSSLLSLEVLDVHGCARLKSLSNLAHLIHLQTFTVWECPKLESVEGLHELPGLKSLIIDDDGCAVALHGLTRMLSLKRIYLIQKVMYDVSVKLNANLFSEVIDAQAVSEIERGEYDLEMKSSLNAITIYALLITSKPDGCIRNKNFYFYHPLPSHTNWLITGLVAENYDEYGLYDTRIKKGFKATVKVGEEGKALLVMQRIVDQLYRDVKRKVRSTCFIS